MIPKKNRPGKWRLICDLSSPKNHSVNNGIDPNLCSMKYISVHDAIREIQKLGKGTLLAKIDINEAYRIVPVHPQDRPLLGFQWHGQTFVDGVLPFGLQSEPKIFDSLASMLNWILIDQCQITIIHYLDDFLIIGPPESPRCLDAIQKTLQTWAQLGVPIAPEKFEGPTTCLTFLGIKIDTIQWWCQFLSSWNGKSLLPPAPATPRATITLDTSGNWGCSAFSGSNWFQI